MDTWGNITALKKKKKEGKDRKKNIQSDDTNLISMTMALIYIVNIPISNK